MAESLNRTQISTPMITLPTGPTGPAGAPIGLRSLGGGSVLGVLPEPGTIRERLPEQYGVTTPTTGLPGSSLDTLYGINAGTYLTADQRKLAQQIQGKFDASVNSRDRALAQYGAPRLSSYVEDEALARAMSLARGLNYREPDTSTAGGIRTQGGGLPKSGMPYVPPRPEAPGAPSNTGAQNAASWQRIMTGLASIAPLLFGRDAYGQFINKGLFPSIKEALFGKDAASVSDAQLQQAIETNGAAYPTQAASDYWATQTAPWGASAEGGLPYPTPEVATGAVTTPFVETPAVSDWWQGGTNSYDFGNLWDFGSLAGP